MFYATAYYFMGRVRRSHFPDYHHHKPFDIYPEGWYWLRAGWRKIAYAIKERSLEAWLSGPMRKRFFLVPLQVFNDSQVKHHSDFKGVRAFISTVLESFAHHAPKGLHLVFKHHPLDRGHRDYTTQIARQARHLGLDGRVHYVHDLHLPTLLRAARGTVVINSTVGLSSLFHGTPLKVMGRALYDVAQLTFAGPLEAFWHRPLPPRPKLVRRFRNFLIHRTQIGGSFYSGRNIELPKREKGQ
jgi:capsular polysaccharide export protein